MLNELELFAGAGGGILGSQLLGHCTICAVELDAYARSVLLARQNDGTFQPFPVWDDIRTFDGKPWRGVIDVVSGGFPCQAFSTESHGRKTAQNLWGEMRRVVSEVNPKYVFSENVSKSAIDQACDDLEEMGYQAKAVSISAKDMGADHIRKRYWLLAHANDKSELLREFNAEVGGIEELQASFWKSNPNESGMDDGVENRTHRLKAIGNGQVPICKAAAWRILINEHCNS